MVSYYMPSESKLGTGHQVHALANALVDRGHDVTVFTRCGPSAGALYRTQTVGVEGSLRTFKFARRLRQVDWSDFDVLHAHNGDFLLWGKSKPPHVRTRSRQLAEGSDPHSRSSRPERRCSTTRLARSPRHVAADTSVAVSRNTQTWLPWVRTRIPNGVDLARFTPGREVPASEHLVRRHVPPAKAGPAPRPISSNRTFAPRCRMPSSGSSARTHRSGRE